MSLTTLVPMTFKRRGVRCLVDTGAPAHDPCLLIALGRAWHWQQLIDAGVVTNGADIARREELHPTTVNKILRLTLLVPDLVEQLMEGNQPIALTLTWLQHHRLPVEWSEQRVLFERLEP
ncbi:Site-specific recombinase resolvase [Gammaproteobacteria bacterium]